VDDVEGVEVKLSSDKSVYVFKGPSDWHLGGIGGERLDENAVQSGIRGIIELRAQRTLTEGVTLTEFGLDAPTATIKLILTNNRTESLSVGDVNPEGFSYYVQRAGDSAVYMVGKAPIGTVLNWVGTPPLAPTPTPAAVNTVVATLTPAPPPTAPVTATVVATPTPPPTPTPTATPAPAGTVITVVVTPTPVSEATPSATPELTPTEAITPTATTKP
jgi:hypothetical protein